ncbi:F-box/LRR-repeat protein 15 [Eurytemora carolleeae]|uniref:F-box/LRR-repeat protein 15 n=1 Tax=Eurytemora carolleeae TaxID=1294199 RepID=UPI000C756649|nr:F-box/LRR-repeat protein 15 [Eurytemora carolleeae]|eukprot:XP_023340255.1 F-box/LRR-repeat protein 15-like [Eurytemora affinis]
MQEVFYIIFVQNFTVLESKDHENQLSLELITMSIRRIQITDLSWTDILFPNVLPLLSVQDWFNLRCVSTDMNSMVEMYLAQNRTLNLSGLKKLSEQAFKILTENATCLKYLNLSGSKIITDDLVRSILENNLELTYINLSDCHHCTADLLHTLTLRNTRLCHLILQDCHWVTRDSIDFHATHQGLSQERKSTPSLIEINLTGCWELTDDVVKNFLSRFPKLKVVELGNIYSLTDTTMKALATYTRDLQVLNIQGCWRISDSGLRTVSEYCPNIVKLKVEDCRAISESSLARLRQKDVDIDRALDRTLLRIQQMRLQYMHDRLVI